MRTVSESAGARLKKIRLEKGLSLEQVHKQTKIHVHILKALEGDGLTNLSPVYVKGFLKIYCNFLGVDPKDYVEGKQTEPVKSSVHAISPPVCLPEKAREVHPPVERPAISPHRHEVKPSGNIPAPSAGTKKSVSPEAVNEAVSKILESAWSVLEIIIEKVAALFSKKEVQLTLVFALAGFLLVSGIIKAGSFIHATMKAHAQRKAAMAVLQPQVRKEKLKSFKSASNRVANSSKAATEARALPLVEKTKVSEPAVAPSVVKEKELPVAVVAPKPPSTDVRLGIRARENCWVSLKADGKVVFQRVLEKGRFQNWEAKEKMELSLGNAGVVELEVNGQLYSNLGRRGQALKNVVITKDGLNIR